MNASELSTNGCSLVKNVRCSKSWRTNESTSSSNGNSTRMSIYFDRCRAEARPTSAKGSSKLHSHNVLLSPLLPIQPRMPRPLTLLLSPFPFRPRVFVL